METPDQETIDRWHRWFAIECNNRGWELASQKERTPAEDREMLAAAYSAAFHWSRIGQPINDVRAEMLLAHAHALLGQGQQALAYASRCVSYCQENECEEWDVAFSHVEMALAGAAAGDAEIHARFYARAREVGDGLSDPEDRKVFDEEFERVPRP